MKHVETKIESTTSRSSNAAPGARQILSAGGGWKALCPLAALGLAWILYGSEELKSSGAPLSDAMAQPDTLGYTGLDLSHLGSST